MHCTQYQPPPFLLGKTNFSLNFGKGGSEKEWVPGGLKESLLEIFVWGRGITMFFHQKNLYKMKCGFETSIFKWEPCPDLAKQPVNV